MKKKASLTDQPHAGGALLSNKTFFSQLIALANSHSSLLAICSDSGSTTLSDVVGNVVALSKVFRAKKIQGRRCVCVASKNPDVNLVMALALMMNGCCVAYSRDLANYEELGVDLDLVLTDQPNLKSAFRTTMIKQEWFTPKKPVSTSGLSIAQNFSVIFPSSGSTGRPKLIEFSADAVFHRVKTKGEHLYFSESKRLLLSTNAAMLSSFVDTLISLQSGGLLIRATVHSAQGMLTAIQKYSPNYFLAAPAMLAEMVELLELNPINTRVNCVRATGAYCPPKVKADALRLLCDVVVTSYGAAEVGRMAWKTASGPEANPRSVGNPVQGVEIAAFDEDGNKLQRGEIGSIRAKVDPIVAGKYVGSTAVTVAPLSNGWFSTGDTGTILEDGSLEIFGRSSAVINFGGNKMHPSFLEEALLSMKGVSAVAVVGVEAPDGFQRICAAMVSSVAVDFESANWHLVAKEFEFPVHLVTQLEKLPLLASGKVDRIALQEQFRPKADVPLFVTLTKHA